MEECVAIFSAIRKAAGILHRGSFNPPAHHAAGARQDPGRGP